MLMSKEVVKMNEYILTIAIPTFNRKEKLSLLLNKLSSISLKEVEIMISDNCSKDGTDVICNRYKEQNEFIYYRQETNIGPDLNFLWLLNNAHGKYVWLVSDDDNISTEFINKLLFFLKNNEISLGFFNYTLINSKTNKKHDVLKMKNEIELVTDKNRFLSKISFENTFLTTILYRKDAFNQILNPERFNNTNFLQTYLAYESTLYSNFPFAIFYETGITAFSNDKVSYSIYKVFGESLRRMAVYLYKNLGFKRKIVNYQYKKYIRKVVYPGIIHAKHYNYNDMLKFPFKMLKASSFSAFLFIETCIVVFTPNFIIKTILHIRKKR